MFFYLSLWVHSGQIDIHYIKLHIRQLTEFSFEHLTPMSLHVSTGPSQPDGLILVSIPALPAGSDRLVHHIIQVMIFLDQVTFLRLRQLILLHYFILLTNC
jgi:hypothetical protein